MVASRTIEESNAKLKFTKAAWDRVGFNLTDRTTWERASASLGKHFNFTTGRSRRR